MRAYLKIVVSFEERTTLQLRSVQLKWLRTWIAFLEEEHIFLDVLVTYRCDFLNHI